MGQVKELLQEFVEVIYPESVPRQTDLFRRVMKGCSSSISLAPGDRTAANFREDDEKGNMPNCTIEVIQDILADDKSNKFYAIGPQEALKVLRDAGLDCEGSSVERV